MANERQSVIVKTYTTSPTTLSGLNTFSVLNASTNLLSISVDGGSNAVDLDTGQTLSLVASTGFILPDIDLSGSAMKALVIST